MLWIALLLLLEAGAAMDYGTKSMRAPWPYHLGRHPSKHHFHTKLCREKGSLNPPMYGSGFVYNIGRGHGSNCADLHHGPVASPYHTYTVEDGSSYKRNVSGESSPYARQGARRSLWARPHAFEVRHKVEHRLHDHVQDYERIVSYDSYLDRPIEVISATPLTEAAAKKRPQPIATFTRYKGDYSAEGTVLDDALHPHPLHVVHTFTGPGMGEYFLE